MIPAFVPEGLLPPGLHAASLREVEARFGGSARRDEQLRLLREVVGAALFYASIKRVLLWGSFVSGKEEPNDLDYSFVVGISHKVTDIAPEHRIYLNPRQAMMRWGVDAGFVEIIDFPLSQYLDRVELLTQRRGDTRQRGIIEISLWGERQWLSNI